VRLVCTVVAIEGALFFGGFAFVSAFLRHEFGLDYVTIGALIGCFGLGGFAYVALSRRIIAALGERGMALAGGAGLAITFALIPLAPPRLAFALVMAATGVAFYVIHNTLQTNATQMAPEARGSAVALFAATFFLGQSGGVALCGAAVDRVGYRPVFLATGVGLLLVGVAFRAVLSRPRAA
jgi:predicted MFS family arabinose efflux permease